MKKTMGMFFVVAVLALSVISVPNVLAETATSTITGLVEEISEQPNVIIVDGTEIYGIRYKYLSKRYNIDLSENTPVAVDVYEFECSDGSIKFMAYAITVDDATVQLRDIPVTP